MPATMMHLSAAHALCPTGSDAFLLGSILPDCVDADRTLKDHLHFRDIPSEDRLGALVAFGKRLDLTRPFDFGALYHFYLDYLWDNGPQSAHRKSYEGEDWFRAYRKELAAAGSRCALRAPWNAEVWARLADPRPEDLENSLALPPEDMKEFLKRNALWHTTDFLPESPVFSDELVDRFLIRARRAFLTFLHDFFPREAAFWAAHPCGIRKEDRD